MDFRETESFLLSLGNEVSAMKLGLENIRKLLGALGDPQTKYLKVQVAGTNGKGSVCAFLDSICHEAGINAGVFTSPHLVSVTERVRINGADISEPEFARHATRVRSVAEELLAGGLLEYMPTFFEQVTAIALTAFAEAEVQLAILETGLGGRLDATTAANAEVVAITRIDLDHQEYLGETIEEIAAEKAATINGETLEVVLGDQERGVMQMLRKHCEELRIEPLNDEYEPWGILEGEGDKVNVINTRVIFNDVTLGIRGRHQIENAQTAIRVAKAFILHGVDIEEEEVVRGLENARHPGRLEFSGKYLFDGAHNASGARALREFLDESVTQPITLIFGAMKGKDIGEIANALFSRAKNLIITRPKNSRAMSPGEIAEFIPPTFDRENLLLTDTVEEALAKANEKTADDGIILVTGSLYLVGEVKKILNN